MCELWFAIFADMTIGGLPEIQEIAFFEGKKENPLLSFAKAEAVVKSFKRVKLKGRA